MSPAFSGVRKETVILRGISFVAGNPDARLGLASRQDGPALAREHSSEASETLAGDGGRPRAREISFGTLSRFRSRTLIATLSCLGLVGSSTSART